MALFLDKSNRYLIPSWKPFSFSQDELRPLSMFQPREVGDISPYVKEWQESKNIVSAGELLSSAIINNRTEEEIVRDAIIFINDADEGVPAPLKNVAKDYSGVEIEPNIHLLSFTELYKKIAALKITLSQYPNNAIYHIDIARCYVLLGQLKKAEDHIYLALYFDSNNRFVVRAASRFYLHIGERKKAVSVLRHSSLLRKDPWLLASEISVSQLCDKSTSNVKRAIQAIESRNYSDFDLTELRSAVGMEELKNGAYKKGAGLINKSLVDPSDNSFAQAQWAINNKQLTLDMPLLINPLYGEANCYELYRKADYENALDAAMTWQALTPYSYKCAMYGSKIATIHLQQYDKSKDMLKNYLLTNKEESVERRTAQNDLAYALALNNKPDEAQGYLDKAFKGVDFLQMRKEDICLIATQGLVEFRKENPDEGSVWYEKAMELCDQVGDKYMLHSAQVNYCRELLRNNKNQNDKDKVGSILASIPKYDKEDSITIIRAEVEKMLSE